MLLRQPLWIAGGRSGRSWGQVVCVATSFPAAVPALGAPSRAPFGAGLYFSEVGVALPFLLKWGRRLLFCKFAWVSCFHFGMQCRAPVLRPGRLSCLCDFLSPLPCAVCRSPSVFCAYVFADFCFAAFLLFKGVARLACAFLSLSDGFSLVAVRRVSIAFPFPFSTAVHAMCLVQRRLQRRQYFFITCPRCLCLVKVFPSRRFML